ncbi:MULTISPECIES: MbtH family protein [Streptomyces]|uniref:MbtH family protein n=1 Tax=Streptomyces lycii TaxID=2654337 RepID=A0ABQ7FCS4_9ACTN|nr:MULTISPECIES: MbtH family protein [Streptomyces]KAF4406450.1 MbtH family protein [Streptomyces lycii]PGH50113.1 MbtH family protein [Streptomyces sp. Ru87]
MTNPGPFDAPDGPRAVEPTHRVLRNAAGQWSLWPAFAPVPAGWDTVHGPAPHASCEEHVERAARAAAEDAAR